MKMKMKMKMEKKQTEWLALFEPYRATPRQRSPKSAEHPFSNIFFACAEFKNLYYKPMG